MRILHLLEWRLCDIKYNLPRIKEQGFNAIQISPIQPCKQGEEWWKLYQPTDFAIGNRLGSREDFINLCNEAKKYEVKIIVDVVLRHLAGRDDGSLFPHEDCNSKITSVRDYWLDPIEANYANCTRWQEVNRCFGMPSLNYYNKELVDNYYRPFLTDVVTYADGIRLDQMKHYALPYENNLYFWGMMNDILKDRYIFAGECINLSKQLLDDYTVYALVITDRWNLPTDTRKAIVFHESHDTYLSFGYTRSCSDWDRLREYDNNLRDFEHVIFYARPWDLLPFSNEIRHIHRNHS